MSEDRPRTANPNRTRDHLANERTFLAWIRTALGLLGLGFVMARMGLFLRQLAAAGVALGHAGGAKTPAGHEFLLVGVVFLVIGTGLAGASARLYHHNRRAIEADNYEPDRLGVDALSAVVIVGGLVVVALVGWHLAVSGL